MHSKRLPRYQCLPYWGSLKERQVLRKYWNQKQLYGRDAAFHVVVTRYILR